MTASPFLTSKKNKSTFEIEDFEENLCLLSKNLDSKFITYDHKNVKQYLKEAKTLIVEFENNKFIQNKGEVFLEYIEDYTSKKGNFEDILSLEKDISTFFTAFKEKISKIIVKNQEFLAEKFVNLVKEIENFLRKKTLRILHELGIIKFSLLSILI